jgi:lambda repressor-like predicted transcriptional regulator
MTKKTVKAITQREIRAELIRLGVKVGEIAQRAGVTSSAVSQTISQYGRYKGYRIRPYIAQALNKNECDIWPDNNKNKIA